MNPSPKLASATPQTTPPIPGQYWPAQKGWYAGIQRSEDGLTGWHLILPKGAKFYFKGVVWGNPGVNLVGANHAFDGMANTIAMAEAGSELAQRIRKLPGDCYIPSRFESALLYATLREQIELGDWYLTSTQYSDLSAWGQNFSGGDQGLSGKKCQGRCRAVRRLPLQSFGPLDVGAA